MSNSYYNSTFTAAIGTLARSSTLRSQFSLIEAGFTALEAAVAPKASPTFTGTVTLAAMSYTGTVTGGTGVINIGSGQFFKDASGNIGIGTATPINNLHVKGASGLAAIRLEAVTDGTLGFLGSASGLGAGAPAGALMLRAENGLEFSGFGNARHARIDTSGNFGIGTSSPTKKLHVAGDVRIDGTTATTATAGANGDVPAQVVGYLTVNINGTDRKIPFYA